MTGIIVNEPFDPWHHPENGLVGHWLPAFETPALVDASGRGNTATATGTTIASSSRGMVRSFNGTSSDYLTIAAKDPLGLNANFPKKTLSVWFRAGDTNGVQTVISKWDAAGFREWIAYLNWSTLTLGVNAQSVEVTHTVAAGRWYHCACVISGTAKAEMFVDGVSRGSSGQVGFQNTATSILIGQNSSTNYFNGLIDDFQMHNRLFSAAEIRDLYERTKSPRLPRRRVYSIPAAAAAETPVEVSTGVFYLPSPSPVRPSYKSGYATPKTGNLAHPNLWKGCVGAWNPGLGRTGLFLNNHAGSNDGTITGADWVVDRYGHALEFSGAEYISASDSPAFASSMVSAFAWVKTPPVVADGMIAAKWYYSAGEREWMLNLQLTGKLQAVISDDGTSSNAKNYDTVATIDDDEWHHVGFSWDGTDLKLFIDGIEQSVTKASDTAISERYHGTGDIQMGVAGSPGTLGSYFTGLISDVSVYSRALNPNEIKTLARRPGIAYERKQRFFFSQPAPAAEETAQYPYWADRRSSLFNTLYLR